MIISLILILIILLISWKSLASCILLVPIAILVFITLKLLILIIIFFCISSLWLIYLSPLCVNDVLVVTLELEVWVSLLSVVVIYLFQIILKVILNLILLKLLLLRVTRIWALKPDLFILEILLLEVWIIKIIFICFLRIGRKWIHIRSKNVLGLIIVFALLKVLDARLMRWNLLKRMAIITFFVYAFMWIWATQVALRVIIALRISGHWNAWIVDCSCSSELNLLFI